ncbi:GTP-binding protein LepA [Microlunatus flavus]|uniref:GTP-binding protein LepA n=1 Tax=Microlunatus flavus TaxID=1036181 RepID=A0A1H9N1R6_9ACTN|nr:GTP-binding protein LepA [Microlunatus flavus]SER29884.1 hypothetical protein SAMN05421756_11251 [Microlunatus flavus]
MTAPRVDATRIRDHVLRLGEKHPPVDLASADFTVRDPAAVRRRFAQPLDYMARVEMEVERNVLELAVMLPGVSETDRLFYADVWAPQEERHGLLLDTLVRRLDLPPAEPDLDGPTAQVRVLGALAHIPAVQEVIRLLYYLTGAATEKSAMLAYAAMSADLEAMGETAVKRTVVDAIKVQEPGHFAFYRMSAQEMIETSVLKPWQLRIARFIRSKAFSLVGASTPERKADFGGVLVNLGLADDLERTVRDVSRLEHHLLWAQDQGMDVPAYALRAFRDAADSYRERVQGAALAA